MPPERKDGCKTKKSHNSNIVYKISDLKKDVDSIKVAYDCGSDPNKQRIDRVLTNMKRKILKAEQIMKFGQHVTSRTVTAELIRVLRGRVAGMKNLFKELMKDQPCATKADRRAICQMYHQLMSMEDDLVHFTDPVQEHLNTPSCRNSGEPHFISIKDCEVQTNKYEDCPGSNKPSPCKSALRNKPLVYTGIAIGFTSPKIELNDLSYSGVGETWKTMFSFNTQQCSLQSTPDISRVKCEGSLISANDSLVSQSYSIAEEGRNLREYESTSDYSLDVKCSTGFIDSPEDASEPENCQLSSHEFYEERQDDEAKQLKLMYE
ncbi:hypothetical protein GE061_015509 [Apolygus lucorum]|uniref:Uncharacterized protein n=1 Tax=Apolygus lucorum TaxID=248454 RepID=A0A8S9XMB4_APOLU|nr:hypothetical protein GE061_015509 [Apolygus lucorum]